MSKEQKIHVNCTGCDWKGTRHQIIYTGKQWSKTDKPCPQCGGHVWRGRPVDHKELESE